jgi:hypothetical protein
MNEFPIIDASKHAGCPDFVPWALIEPHEAQAKTNHGGQDFRGLSNRGGLSAAEMVAVLSDKKYNDYWSTVDKKHQASFAVLKLKKFVADFKSSK